MLAECYTPLMAKRFNVSIPDALAERLEPLKDKISLSAVMQAALERELAQLTRIGVAQNLRTSFKEAAINSWLQRNKPIYRAIFAFVDQLIDSAVNDRQPELFPIYRNLYIRLRKDELREKLLNDGRYGGIRIPLESSNGETEETRVNSALEYADDWNMSIEDSFISFVEDKVKQDDGFLPPALWEVSSDGKILLSDDLREALQHSGHLQEIALKLMDERIRDILSEKEIDAYILDFESAFGQWEEEG